MRDKASSAQKLLPTLQNSVDVQSLINHRNVLRRLGEVGMAGLGNSWNKVIWEFGEITQAEMNFSFVVRLGAARFRSHL